MTSISSYSTTTRITGLVSGLDVDGIVESLMEAEEIPLEKLKQKQQLLEWKQDAYREAANLLRAFADQYLNYANSSSNMLSQSAYRQYALSSSDESVVTITAGTEAAAGSHTVSVQNLAAAASYKSAAAVTSPITASAAADFTAAAGGDFIVELDGTQYRVSLAEGTTGPEDLQEAIDEAVGSGKIKVSDTNGDGTGRITLTKAEDSGIGTITLSDAGDSGTLAALGFSGEDSLTNYLDTTATLEEISARLATPISFDAGGEVSLTINEVSFTFSQSTTLAGMLEEINASGAGVTMTYSTDSDSFVITADQTGAGRTLSLSETDSAFLEATGLSVYTAGEDAVVLIDGQKYTRSGNSLTVSGITYTLKAESTETQTVAVTQDTAAVYEKISGFVEAYNTLIDSINSMISQEYDRDYQPLTADQKAEMSDDEIEAWEKKAKTGMLENDSTLAALLRNMRSALYTSVSGVSLHLTEIGITTSSAYEDKGKLIIDEEALKEAIESDPEGVMDLFAQESQSYSGTTTVVNLTAEKRKVRTSEEGLAYRIYDLLQDNISTYTGIDGQKGLLIEKAGLEGDGSEYDNTLTARLEKYGEEVDAMLARLEEKEEYYYEKYSAMETYISQMNTQLETLLSYLE